MIDIILIQRYKYNVVILLYGEPGTTKSTLRMNRLLTMLPFFRSEIGKYAQIPGQILFLSVR